MFAIWWGSEKGHVTYPGATVVYNTCYLPTTFMHAHASTRMCAMNARTIRNQSVVYVMRRRRYIPLEPVFWVKKENGHPVD